MASSSASGKRLTKERISSRASILRPYPLIFIFFCIFFLVCPLILIFFFKLTFQYDWFGSLVLSFNVSLAIASLMATAAHSLCF